MLPVSGDIHEAPPVDPRNIVVLVRGRHAILKKSLKGSDVDSAARCLLEGHAGRPLGVRPGARFGRRLAVSLAVGPLDPLSSSA